MPSIVNILSLPGVVDGAHWVQMVAAAADHYGQQLLGSAVINHAESDVPTLCDVFVPEPYRRLGIATQLVQQAKRWADGAGRDLYLHVRPENEGAIRLYRREGFEATGEVRDDGSQWMMRELAAGPEGAPLPRKEVAGV